MKPERAMHGRYGWARRYRDTLAITDALVVLAVMTLAQVARFGGDPLADVAGNIAPPYALVTAIIGIAWWLALGAYRSRDARILGHGIHEFQRVVTASWVTFAWVAVISFAFQISISRQYLLFALPLGIIALVSYRAAWRSVIHAQRDRGRACASVVVVGPPVTVRQLIGRLEGAQRAGYRVIGVALPPGSTAKDDFADLDIPFLGVLDRPVEQLNSVGAEFVVVAGNDAMSLRESRRLGWELEGTDLGLIVVPSMVDVAGPRVHMTPVVGLPLLHVESPQFKGYKYWLKMAFDKSAALVGLLLLAPFLLAVAIAVKLTSPGPVLFRQERIGQGMQTFTMYKFRSMYVDAEARLSGLLDHNQGNGVHFKMKADPRWTPIGGFIRRYSIDELPQLFNVLKGDMSLVGPRPPLQREVDAWDERVLRRQLVKPGLTGLWQVSGRSDLAWEEAVRLDLYYTENWSLASDLVIVLRTIWVIIRPKGAY